MSKVLYLLLISYFLMSCKKDVEKPSFNELTNLKNYKIKETKVNDSTIKISGENKEYMIEGNFNKIRNKREKWWKVISRKNNETIEIEYIILDKEKINQIKVYIDGNLIKSMSRYYVIENTPNKFRVNFYFSEYLQGANKGEPNKEKYEVTFRVFDTIKNKIMREAKMDLQKNKNFYYFETPKLKNENGITGFADKLLFQKVNDSVQMSVETVYFRD